MRIDYLYRRPHFLPTLAEWMYREWSAKMGVTLAQAVTELRHRLNEDELPLALVAFTDEPLGMATLLEDVPPEGYEPVACLAGLYVAPAWRRRGVGGRLCQRALREARRLGHVRLSLYTPDQEAFYARRGWVKCVDTVVASGETHRIVTFMECPVDAAGDGSPSGAPALFSQPG
jgi:predicted N-acetyltransferase YhbS